ncbi:MAG: ThiF family adenylyltransferase, partial [Janthinobacterium lividum]
MNNELTNDIYQPTFFRLNQSEDKERYQLLLQSESTLYIHDEIEGQLRELIKSLNPSKKINSEQYPQLIEKHLDGQSIQNYGVWVFYPWNKNLIHLLDEEEFVEVRTNRNRYKITIEEQQKLKTKKVGVIGLSVGQSVSLTLAIERCFGELRIADFDELELSNLNRLRTGVHNLGLKKTVIVAREIAEIDPFLKVTCFHNGITEDNIEEFLLANGKLDVLIDECDGVDIKLKCRIEAKKHQIPVLMEASDRGTVDVERFDLEPNRPLLHGYIEHLDVSKFSTLTTNEQKLPYILAFAGIETLSVRMKASAVEVGQTISTWPQLAS